MLDVDRRVDVDARREQLLDVAHPLRVTAAGRVRVRELVDDRDRGLPGADGIEVHLLEHLSTVIDPTTGNHLEAVEERARLGPAMGLDDAHHHVDAVTLELLRRLQHRVRLPDAWCGTDEDLEARAFLSIRGLEKRVGRRAAVLLGKTSGHDAPILALRSRCIQRAEECKMQS